MSPLQVEFVRDPLGSIRSLQRCWSLKLSRVDFCFKIYLSIYGIYIAPLQGNCSEALPVEALDVSEEIKNIAMKNFGARKFGGFHLFREYC